MPYRWVQRFTPEFVEAARTCRHVPGGRWFVDETYAKANGRWTYLYRAIDQYGQVIDVRLSARRDLTAARIFFIRPLATGAVPVEVTTDRAPVYPRILDELAPGRPAHDTAIREQHDRSRPWPGSKPGSDPCVDSRPSDQRGSSPPVTPSCRTSDAATTTSPPTHQSTTEIESHSMSWRSPSEPPRASVQPCHPIAQRNRAQTYLPKTLDR